MAVIPGIDMDLSTETPKRRSADSSSPEFEFWVVGNPSYPQQELLTADELFVDGVLLPLHLLSVVHSEPDREPEPAEPPPDPSPLPSPASITSSISSSSSGSKRWKDIFKVGEKKEGQRREWRGSGAAELNINIWPFYRSRSAGNDAVASRPRASAIAGRKTSSAPCSRSNSCGESFKPSAAADAGGPTRRWAGSPGRAGLSGGVHLGRTSPVWQIRRGAKRIEPAAGRGPERANQRDKVTGSKKGSGIGGGVGVLNLNVNACIGHRNQVSYRGDDKDGDTGGGQTARQGGGSNGSFFSLRSFFSKKVY